MAEASWSETWSVTYLGHKFYYGPHMGQSIVEPGDIAHHLSQVNRYGGAAKYPYSVAQHSWNMCSALYRDTGDAVLALDGLVHDAEEAYGYGDVISPVKSTIAFAGAKGLGRRIDRHVRGELSHMGVLLVEHRLTKEYDLRILHDEVPALLKTDIGVWALPKHLTALGGVRTERWTPEQAERAWMGAWDGLTKLIARRRAGRSANPPKLVAPVEAGAVSNYLGATSPCPD